MIYLDNAATTLHKPPEVIQAVTQALSSLGNAARGAHGGSLNAARTVYNTRVKVAAFFNAPDPSHVIFTANSTEALNTALFGLLRKGDHVITTDLEHNSVLRPLYALEEEKDVTLSFVKADRKGRLDHQDFARLIRPETKAIVCTHGSNLTGNLLDIQQIGTIAKAHDLLFIVDVSQTAGEFPIDMEAMQISVLCFTGHKGLYGPQGTGGMCIAKGVEIAPFKRGGSGIHSYDPHQPMDYPTRLEAGTLNSHSLAGLNAALDFLGNTGLAAIAQKERALTEHFYQGVSSIPGVTVYGDFSTHKRCPIVALNIRDYDSAAVADTLARQYNIAVRAGAHCAPRMHQALGTARQGAVRFSFSWFNTTQEADAAIAAVREIAEE